MEHHVTQLRDTRVPISLGVFQARDTLVASYKQLRAGDVTGGTVYRITVRQLEALIRLSEAHARVRCSNVIEPRDVREVRLCHTASELAYICCAHIQEASDSCSCSLPLTSLLAKALSRNLSNVIQNCFCDTTSSSKYGPVSPVGKAIGQEQYHCCGVN